MRSSRAPRSALSFIVLWSGWFVWTCAAPGLCGEVYLGNTRERLQKALMKDRHLTAEQAARFIREREAKTKRQVIDRYNLPTGATLDYVRVNSRTDRPALEPMGCGYVTNTQTPEGRRFWEQTMRNSGAEYFKKRLRDALRQGWFVRPITKEQEQRLRSSRKMGAGGVLSDTHRQEAAKDRYLVVCVQFPAWSDRNPVFNYAGNDPYPNQNAYSHDPDFGDPRWGRDNHPIPVRKDTDSTGRRIGTSDFSAFGESEWPYSNGAGGRYEPTSGTWRNGPSMTWTEAGHVEVKGAVWPNSTQLRAAWYDLIFNTGKPNNLRDWIFQNSHGTVSVYGQLNDITEWLNSRNILDRGDTLKYDTRLQGGVYALQPGTPRVPDMHPIVKLSTNVSVGSNTVRLSRTGTGAAPYPFLGENLNDSFYEGEPVAVRDDDSATWYTAVAAVAGADQLQLSSSAPSQYSVAQNATVEFRYDFSFVVDTNRISVFWWKDWTNFPFIMMEHLESDGTWDVVDSAGWRTHFEFQRRSYHLHEVSLNRAPDIYRITINGRTSAAFTVPAAGFQRAGAGESPLIGFDPADFESAWTYLDFTHKTPRRWQDLGFGFLDEWSDTLFNEEDVLRSRSHDPTNPLGSHRLKSFCYYTHDHIWGENWRVRPYQLLHTRLQSGDPWQNFIDDIGGTFENEQDRRPRPAPYDHDAQDDLNYPNGGMGGLMVDDVNQVLDDYGFGPDVRDRYDRIIYVFPEDLNGTSGGVWSGAHTITPQAGGNIAIVPEWTANWPVGNLTADGLRLIAHEISHTYGAVDLYDTDNYYNAAGFQPVRSIELMMGPYSVMASGVRLDPFNKIIMGWLRPIEVLQDSLKQQFPMSEGALQSPTILKLWVWGRTTPDVSDDEFFLVENHYNTSDKFFGDPTFRGMLIHHVDLRADRADTSPLETGFVPEPFKGQGNPVFPRVILEQADGGFELETANLGNIATDPFGGNSGDPLDTQARAAEFSHRTVPNSRSHGIVSPTTYQLLPGSDYDSFVRIVNMSNPAPTMSADVYVLPREIICQATPLTASSPLADDATGGTTLVKVPDGVASANVFAGRFYPGLPVILVAQDANPEYANIVSVDTTRSPDEITLDRALIGTFRVSQLAIIREGRFQGTTNVGLVGLTFENRGTDVDPEGDEAPGISLADAVIDELRIEESGSSKTDADVESVTLFDDTNNDGIFSPSTLGGPDKKLDTRSVTNQLATFTKLNYEVKVHHRNDSNIRRMFVAYNIARTATVVPPTTLSATVRDASYITPAMPAVVQERVRLVVASPSDPDGDGLGAPRFPLMSNEISVLATTVTQTKFGSISGLISDSDTGAPVTGVQVDVLDGSNNIVATQITFPADTDGDQASGDLPFNYRIQNLPVGTYTVQATNGTQTATYLGGTLNVTVVDQKETPGINIVLGAVQPPPPSVKHTFPSNTTLMVSAPLDYTDDAAKVFGVSASSLQLATYDPISKRYVLYPQPPSDTVTLGKGYFARFGSQATLSVNGARAPMLDNTTFQPFEILLKRGWNLIGYPYDPTVGTYADGIDWYGTKVKVSGGSPTSIQQAAASGMIQTGLFTLNASSTGYQLSTTMLPFVGYWTKALQNGVSIVLSNQPIVHGALPARREALGQKELSALLGRDLKGGWTLRLCASAGNLQDRDNFAGMAPEARDGLEATDLEKPPLFILDQFVDLAFVHNDWGDDSGRYAVDVRSDFAGEKTWDFEVVTNVEGSPVTLTWPDLGNLPKQYRAYLHDVESGMRRYLRTTSSYTFAPTGQLTPRRFRLVVTSATLGQLRVSSVRQLASERQQMRLSFVLSQEATVRARVLSAAGRTVAELALGPREAGQNFLTWNQRDRSGRTVSRGTYLLELTATDPEDGRTVRAVRSLRIG